jgi:hypothetical protein
MKTPLEQAKVTALIQTVLLCAVVEGVVLVVLTQFTVNLLEAAAVSVVFLGPLSLWLGPPLYRRLLPDNL